ncbi:MAG: RNA polymerase factor sigma-54 [Bacteroidales bacterium]|nr:RNA polymerase factor sigma-54 [Bacteroidales bacterium]
MVKLGMTQELKQKQTLSPLQIQTIKLLELPTLELEQCIQKEIEENPVLEEISEQESEENDTPKNVSLSEYGNSDPTPSYKLYVNNQGKDAKPEYNTFSVKESLHQSLENQIGYCNLDDRQMEIARYMIGMIETDGYLRSTMESIWDNIAFKQCIETTLEELEEILTVIQGLEPAGVGARDVRECLLLQLRQETLNPNQEIARRILEECFEDLAKKHFDKILRKLDITEDQLRAAQAEIQHLNPYPGGQIDDTYTDQAQQIVPDFLLEITNQGPVVTMPRMNVPELRISRRYGEMLEAASRSKSPAERETVTFIKQKMDSAKYFVEALKQRHRTLQSTMEAIVEYQYDYFMTGDETKLRPMVLRNIAERTGLDISTISRVVNSKYVQTNFGIISLKYFFSEGLTDQSGETVSTREIKTILKECIGAEDKHHPLTDEQLVELLQSKGYNVARRTVAKYRDVLEIPIARLRREL